LFTESRHDGEGVSWKGGGEDTVEMFEVAPCHLVETRKGFRSKKKEKEQCKMGESKDAITGAEAEAGG